MLPNNSENFEQKVSRILANQSQKHHFALSKIAEVPKLNSEQVAETLKILAVNLNQSGNRTSLQFDDGEGFLPNGFDLDIWEIVSRF